MPREARRNWPVRIFKPGEEPDDRIADFTTAEERIEMVWLLTQRMCELTNTPPPSYTRANMPVRILRA